MKGNQNSPEETAFFLAIKRGDLETIRSLAATSPDLLRARDTGEFGGTPLNVAVFKHDRAVIDLLLELGADPNDQSQWWAGPWNAVQSALNYGYTDLAEHFVAHGAKIGIHEAAGLKRLDLLKSLLDGDPHLVHARGGDGCTPLHFAASTQVVDVLRDHGADLDARDVDHYSTPAQYLAKTHPDVARYLFDVGAASDIFSAILAGDLATVQRLVADDPSVLEQRINQQTFPPGPDDDVHNIMTFTVGADATPLHAAASAGQLLIIDWLVDAGMDVNVRGAYDESTALHSAAWNDMSHVAQKLVLRGANIDARSGEIHNNSPAGWAIVAGSADVFCYLMDEGAQVLEWFLGDAEAAVAGEFGEYKTVDPANYKRILERLQAVS